MDRWMDEWMDRQTVLAGHLDSRLREIVKLSSKFDCQQVCLLYYGVQGEPAQWKELNLKLTVSRLFRF